MTLRLEFLNITIIPKKIYIWNHMGFYIKASIKKNPTIIKDLQDIKGKIGTWRVCYSNGNVGSGLGKTDLDDDYYKISNNCVEFRIEVTGSATFTTGEKMMCYPDDHDKNIAIVDRIAAKFNLNPVDQKTASFCLAGSGDLWYSFFDILYEVVQRLPEKRDENANK